MAAHVVCLSNAFLEPGQFLPIEGECPLCQKTLLWGELIRKKNGCCDLQTAESDDEDGDGEEIIISDIDDDCDDG